MMVIDPSVFGDGYKERTQQMIDELHAQEPAPGFEKVLIPGEIEQKKWEASKVDGIEIAKSIVDFLSN
jgi:ureidoglycolate dehydrogenase (NAD+)